MKLLYIILVVYENETCIIYHDVFNHDISCIIYHNVFNHDISCIMYHDMFNDHCKKIECCFLRVHSLKI